MHPKVPSTMFVCSVFVFFIYVIGSLVPSPLWFTTPPREGQASLSTRATRGGVVNHKRLGRGCVIGFSLLYEGLSR